MPAYKIKSGPSKGILAHRFMSPPNKDGIKRRLYVQCPPEYNTHVFLQKMEREAIDRHMAGKFTTSDTFGSYVRERFLDEYAAAKNLQPSSRYVLQWNLEKVAIPEIGNIALHAIDAGVVGRLVAKLATKMKKTKKEVKRQYSDMTIRLAVAAIKVVLRWAAKLGDLKSRPEIDLPKVANYRRPRPYNRDESQQLIACAGTKTELAVFLLIFDAGLRESEVLGLNPEQLDFHKHMMLIDRQRYRGVVRHTKSGRERSLGMSGPLEDALKAIRRVGGDFVIAHPDGQPYTAAWVRKVFERARIKAGLRYARVHDGRHAYATLRTAAGVTPFALKDLLGHSDIKTTQLYVHPEQPTPGSVMDTVAR